MEDVLLSITASTKAVGKNQQQQQQQQEREEFGLKCYEP